MIEIKTNWTKENINEYVRFTTFSKNSKSKLLIALYIVCIALIVFSGIIAYLIMKDMFIIIVVGLATLMLLGFWGVFYFMLKSYANQILQANKSDIESTYRLDDKTITVLSEGKILGYIPWENINTIEFNKNSIYIMTKESSLLIIESDKISYGTKKELIELLNIIKEKK